MSGLLNFYKLLASASGKCYIVLRSRFSFFWREPSLFQIIFQKIHAFHQPCSGRTFLRGLNWGIRHFFFGLSLHRPKEKEVFYLGELDKKQKQYFEDPRRFADIWNALMFQGLEVVSSEELSEGSPVQSYADPDQTLERIADMIMKRVSDGNLLALLVLENAGNVDYAITPKIFLEEALAYNKQVKQIRRRNKKLREAMKAFGPVGELLYQFKIINC